MRPDARLSPYPKGMGFYYRQAEYPFGEYILTFPVYILRM